MEDKFDLMSAVKGEEKTVFYIPKNNYYVAGKATLAEGEIYSNTTNLEYVGYKHLDVTKKHIAVIYTIWLLLAFAFSSMFGNYSLFSMTIVIVGFDFANKRKVAEYIANIYLWRKDPILKEQKSWIGATIMTMKAYKKLRRIPKLEDIKQENVYYSYEESNTFLNLAEAMTLTLFGIIETFYRTNAFLEIMMMIVTMCIIYLLLSHELRPFVGGYRMKKPNDRQIEVAREALKEYDAMLEKVNQNSDSKFFNPTNVGNDFDKCYGMIFSVEMEK